MRITEEKALRLVGYRAVITAIEHTIRIEISFKITKAKDTLLFKDLIRREGDKDEWANKWWIN